ncbi:hypothetical protein GF367_02935 [Candidatus Woesearchaeota archaeon]|nr:hypothetical protein [Candidatus Woesearchaeota archaeon]
MNKQGGTFSTLSKAILAFTLLVVLLFVAIDPFSNVANFFIKRAALEDADYDRDGKLDEIGGRSYDESPCVYGEAVVEIAGKSEYLYELANNGDCNFPEMAAQGVTLVKMIDTSTNPPREVCIYPYKVCQQNLEAYHDKLIAEEKARREAEKG